MDETSSNGDGVDLGGAGGSNVPGELDSPQSLERAITAAKAGRGGATSAATDSSAGNAGSPESPAGTTPLPAATATVDDAAAPTPDQLRMLRNWRLPAPREGETAQQVWDRLDRHDRGRYDDHKRQRQEMKVQLDNMRSLIEPMARSFFERQQNEQRERAMAALPDPEADPIAYNRLLAEETLRRLTEREQNDARTAQEQQQMNELLDMDDENVAELEQAISDPELHKAYSFVTQIGWRNAQRMFPDADDGAIQEFVQNAQILDMRNHRARGLNIAQSIRQTANDAWELARQLYGGTGQPAAVVAQALNGGNGAQPAAGNGNGHARQPASPASPAPVPAPNAGSPTAARLTREHAQATARSAVSGGAGGRGSAPSGEGIDLRRLTADEALKLALAGKITDEMLAAQLGASRG